MLDGTIYSMTNTNENKSRPFKADASENTLDFTKFTSNAEQSFNDLFEDVMKELRDLKEQIKPVSKFFDSLDKLTSKSCQPKSKALSQTDVENNLTAKVLRRMKRKGVI